MSIRSQPLSSAIRKMIVRISLCRSFNCRMRASRTGPISETVVRSRMPFSPYISQSVTGHPFGVKAEASTPQTARRSAIFSFVSPGSAMPARSPFTSARNTGTPIAEKVSAITFSVTVFPVPVAPAMSPCRFAIFGKMTHFSPPAAVPTQIVPSFNMMLSPFLPLGIPVYNIPKQIFHRTDVDTKHMS